LLILSFYSLCIMDNETAQFYAQKLLQAVDGKVTFVFVDNKMYELQATFIKEVLVDSAG